MLKFFLTKKGLAWVAVMGAIAGAGFVSQKFLTASLSDSVVVTQTVTSECNRNGVCEKDFGENILNCEHDCPTSSFSKGGDKSVVQAVPKLWGLEVVDITENSARLKWNTDLESTCELQWGKTDSYEKGSFAEVGEVTSHSVFLENLSELTTYHFKIFCRHADIEIYSEDQKFTTLVGKDDTAPENVSNLVAWYFEEEDKVVLRWKNPDDDFAGVYVLRNDKYFPRDRWDGIPLCQGNIQSCDDFGVEENKKYYYTVFSYDRSENYSSGAVISLTLGGVPQKKGDESATSTVSVNSLSLDDFIFEQDGKQLEKRNDYRVAMSGKTIVIYVDYEKFNSAAKQAIISVVVSMKDQSYLFRANMDRKAYISEIFFDQSDIYPFVITVTDLSGKETKFVGKLLIEGGYKDLTSEFSKDVVDEVVPDIILLIALSLLIAISIERRLKKRKKTPKL